MQSISSEGSTLYCPVCGHNNMRSLAVETFWRAEDAGEGMHVISNPVQTVQDKSMQNNPSERRDGTRIGFVCEGCGKHSFICVVQHKGETVIAWEERKA